MLNFHFPTVTKMSPRPSLVPDTLETTAVTESLTASSQAQQQQQQTNQNSAQKVDPAKPPRYVSYAHSYIYDI